MDNNNFNELKQELVTKLHHSAGNISNFLETDKNIYRIEADIGTNQAIFITPAIKELTAKELVRFDVYQERKDSVSFIDDESKLPSLQDLSQRFENTDSNESNIFKNGEKIKYFYIKCGNVIFVYRYTSKAYLKSKTFLKFDTKELELVTEKEDRITLDKQSPDLIFDMETNRAFLLNIKQSEFIIELDVAITKTKEGFGHIQSENNIFSTDGFEKFKDEIAKTNKTKSRKFVKMIEEKTYQKFVNHRDKAPAIKERYQLDIQFTDDNEIDFNEETSIDAVLHLLADDYVQSYLDEEALVKE